MWILSCLAPVGRLSRMTQWKVLCTEPFAIGYHAKNIQSKLSLPADSSLLDPSATKSKLRLGLFSYPVLQAADILLYK